VRAPGPSAKGCLIEDTLKLPRRPDGFLASHVNRLIERISPVIRVARPIAAAW
jgi:hypothetical protein